MSYQGKTSAIARHWLTVLRWCRVVSVIQHLKVEAEEVDGDPVLPGVVLLGTGEKGLREEKASDPEDVRRTILKPVLQETTTSSTLPIPVTLGPTFYSHYKQVAALTLYQL